MRYAIVSEEFVNQVFEGVSLSLHGLSTFALCAALNHQRRFRSRGLGEPRETETDPLLRRYDKISRTVSIIDGIFVLLAIAYVVFTWLAVYLILTKWVFLAFFLLQRIPVIFLTIVIIFAKPQVQGAILHPSSSGTVTEPAVNNNTSEGPTKKAKVLLALATIVSISGDVPLSLWAAAFGTDCIFWIGNGVDLLHIFYVTGLILYFAFLRSEYLRNMEECIWHTVERFQRSFNFQGQGDGDFNFRKF